MFLQLSLSQRIVLVRPFWTIGLDVKLPVFICGLSPNNCSQRSPSETLPFRLQDFNICRLEYIRLSSILPLPLLYYFCGLQMSLWDRDRRLWCSRPLEMAVTMDIPVGAGSPQISPLASTSSGFSTLGKVRN